MPQPPLDLNKYLSTPLPHLREQYPPGTGGTGPRAEFSGDLKGVQEIENFDDEVTKYFKTLPSEPITPHPHYKYPKFVAALNTIPNPLKTPSDLQKALSSIPLLATSSVLTALDSDPEDFKFVYDAQALDRAGYESDGGVDGSGESKPLKPDYVTKPWTFKFNKSPLGSGEFLLTKGGSDDVKLVVRTINSSAFTSADWKEYIVTSPYKYNIKSKASWYWSRSYNAAKRLGCQYYVLTDWQRWTFGYFNEDRTHGWTSPILEYDAEKPSVLQALLFWTRSAIGAENGYKPIQKDVSSLPELFPANPARRISSSGNKPHQARDERKPRKANESDIEESDAEDAS
ncbi:hypothetical protein I204_00091 [Kwoniella mangroviensis CBS 8886]|nr:hypothetical protein I204_00091 [Kwoniella mangroviensis CBS 8886]